MRLHQEDLLAAVGPKGVEASVQGTPEDNRQTGQPANH